MTIEDVPGRPARRYCTAAHRSAARQARRAAVASGQDRRLAATLPWLREPDAEPEPTHPTPTHPKPTRPAQAPAWAQTASPEGPRVEGARNRAARRRAVVGRPADPVPGARTPGLDAPVPRRRRALAILGAAGILAGGYAVTASEPPAVSTSPQSAPEGETSVQWASRARVALTSVNEQLDTIAEVEAEWFALPATQRAASPAAPVDALVERKQLLERRRAMLESQLHSFESLWTARAELQESEQYLAAVEEALAEAPAPSARTPEQQAALAALDEQRDLRLRQRDARREELAALERGVQDAAARPVPDDDEETVEVGQEVREVIRGGPATPAPPTQAPLPPQPEVVGGREEQEGTPRQDVANSAPPDPRGPGDETAQEPRDADRAAGGGPVGEVVDTVGGVIDGDDRDRDRERAKDRPSDPSSGNGRGDGGRGGQSGGGPVDTVVDTVDDVADGPSAASAERQDSGPVGAVVGTVEDVADGPDDRKDRDREDRDRDRSDRDRSREDRDRVESRDEGPDEGARGDGRPTEALEPVVEPVIDALRSDGNDSGGRADAVQAQEAGLLADRDDARPRVAPSGEDAAPASAAPAGAPARAGDGDRLEDMAAVAAMTMAADMLTGMPGGAWAAPMVEAAAQEAVRTERTSQRSSAAAPEPAADTATADTGGAAAEQNTEPPRQEPSPEDVQGGPDAAEQRDLAAAQQIYDRYAGLDDMEVDELNQAAADPAPTPDSSSDAPADGPAAADGGSDVEYPTTTTDLAPDAEPASHDDSSGDTDSGQASSDGSGEAPDSDEAHDSGDSPASDESAEQSDSGGSGDAHDSGSSAADGSHADDSGGSHDSDADDLGDSGETSDSGDSDDGSDSDESEDSDGSHESADGSDGSDDSDGSDGSDESGDSDIGSGDSNGSDESGESDDSGGTEDDE